MSTGPKKSQALQTLAEPTVSPPVANVRIGPITANIWERASEKGPFYEVSFERRVYDPADLLVLAKVADLAYIRILDFQYRNRK